MKIREPRGGSGARYRKMFQPDPDSQALEQSDVKYGGPVLEWWRPGGSDMAITVRGRTHTLACRPVAGA
jgi:hypothetical protein